MNQTSKFLYFEKKGNKLYTFKFVKERKMIFDVPITIPCEVNTILYTPFLFHFVRHNLCTSKKFITREFFCNINYNNTFRWIIILIVIPYFFFFFFLHLVEKFSPQLRLDGGAVNCSALCYFSSPPGIVNIGPAGSIFILSRNPRYNANRSGYNASTFILCAKPSLCLHDASWHTACNTTSLLTRQLSTGLRVSACSSINLG